MNTKLLIEKIKKQAKKDARNRRDRRYLDTMGFLVAKGFLQTNTQIPLFPNKRLQIEDVIWAGKNVEPRILEVLPAAVLRLERHFDLDPAVHTELATVVAQLRKKQEAGDDFCGIPYKKTKVWADLPLKDQRMKPHTKKRVTKTFRFQPETIDRLEKLAKKQSCTVTAVIEQMTMSAAKF